MYTQPNGLLVSSVVAVIMSVFALMQTFPQIVHVTVQCVKSVVFCSYLSRTAILAPAAISVMRSQCKVPFITSSPHIAGHSVSCDNSTRRVLLPLLSLSPVPVYFEL